MPRTLLALLVTLVAVPALAQDAKALGFTQDGAFFAVGRYDSIGSEDIGGYFIFNTRSGEEEMEDPESYEGLTLAQYQAWVAKHPLAPLKTGPKSPDGKLQVEAGKGGKWKDGLFTVSGVSTWTGSDEEPPPVPKPTAIAFSVKAGKKRWPSKSLSFDHQNVDHSVEFVWSPDGKRVAYVVHTEGIGSPAGGYEVAFGPTQGPRVQVLGVEKAPEEALTQAVLALEGAGFAPTGAGKAKGEHPTSVVFAAKGFEADAKKAAAAIPGARVDKLTWKVGYDLVVVISGQ
jgi:hypothetical protein